MIKVHFKISKEATLKQPHFLRRGLPDSQSQSWFKAPSLLSPESGTDKRLPERLRVAAGSSRQMLQLGWKLRFMASPWN